MRIGEDIRLVRGQRRFAVYDLNYGVCEPASTEEAVILERLARGIQVTPKATGYPSKLFWRVMSGMRHKQWISQGSPKRTSIELSFDKDTTDIKPKRLERVWIETTLACNLRCNHCYANSSPDLDREGELTLDQWQAVFCDLLEYGVDHLTFIGGEPTLRKEVITLGADLVRQQAPDTDVGIFSNLFSFGRSQKDIRLLKGHNLKVSTSLYGMNASDHDFVTTRPGSWVKTISSIRRLADHGIDVFVGYFMTSPDDSPSVVPEWLTELGVSQYDIQSHENVGRAVKMMPRPRRTENRLPNSISFQPANLQRYSQRHNCFSDHLAITPHGEVLACIMMRDPVLGRLPDKRIEQVLSGDRFADLAGLTKEAVEGCSVCEYRYACFDCRPAAVSNSGNLREKPDCGYDPRLPLSTEV
ncbi:MAG: radical SAM protein [Candidatus Thiodiazotropha sp.]